MTNPHALIVDDNANNLEVLAALLDVQGITYTAVKDSVKVGSVLETIAKIDIVFCDLEMPQMDGYELLSALRQQLGASVPIVACTVHLREIATTREMGFDGFIGKPIDSDKFPDQVARILNGQAVWELP